MKIKTRLYGNLVLGTGLAIVFALILVWSSYQIASESEKSETANKLVRETTDLIMIGEEYLVYRYPRTILQWKAKYNTTMAVLKDMKKSAESDRIKKNLITLNKSFLKLKENFLETRDQPEKRLSQAFMVLDERLSGQMRILSRNIIWNALKLSMEATDQTRRIEQKGNMVLFVFLGLFILLTAASLFSTIKKITMSLAGLERDANIINNGNLKHKISTSIDLPNGPRDEIEGLSQSFSNMTGRLVKTIEKLETEVTKRTEAEDKLKKAHDGLEKKVEERTEELAKANNELTIEVDDRKQAERALKKSEGKYRGLVEGLDEAVYRMSLPDGKYEYVSPAAKKVFGYSAEEFIENPLMIGKLMHPDFAEYFKKKWADLIEHKVSPTYKYKILDPEGNERWIVQSNTGIFDDSGNIIAIEGLCRDITKRTQAEKALQESEEKFRTFTEMAPVGVFVTDADGLTTYWNKRLCEITGMQVVEGLGTGWADGVHPDDRERVFKEWYESAEKRASFSCEYRFVDRNGAVTHTIGQASPLIDASSRVTGYVGTITDVTDLKQAEEALRESEQENRLILSNMSDYVWVLDLITLRVTYVSPVVEKILGYSPDEMKTLDLDAFFSPETMETVTGVIEKEISIDGKDGIDPDRRIVMELEIFHKGGTEMWTEISFSLLRDNEGKPTSLIGITRDITERKQRESQFQQAQKMEAIATLAGGVAHEFNNSLVGIMGHIELLKMNLPEDEGRNKSLHAMNTAGHRMSRLTDQLLAYAQGGKYQPKDLKLDDFVIETLPILQHDLSPTVRVETHFSKDNSYIKGDYAQMQMVLSAILANANEAIEDTGLIKIAAENIDIDEDFTKQHPDLKPGPYVCLTIEDNGKGMDEETRSGIFEPFFTTKFQGRGMGMAAVHGIVMNHDGWISVDSEFGKGTNVQIYLPAIEVEIKKPIKTKAEVDRGSGTILMIEDEDVVIEVTQAMLEMLGYRVMVAKTGNDAIHISETFDEQIDLALLDIKLPDIDGRNLYPLIMKARSNLKVIVFSGYSIDGPAREILDAGAQDFIQKPFSIATLSEKLKEVLEGE